MQVNVHPTRNLRSVSGAAVGIAVASILFLASMTFAPTRASARTSSSNPLVGTELVDSLGHVIGPFDPTFSEVLVKINGQWFNLPVDKTGFVNTVGIFAFGSVGCDPNGQFPGLFFASFNMVFNGSGGFAGSDDLGSLLADILVFRHGNDSEVDANLLFAVANGTLYYATTPLQDSVFQSFAFVDDPNLANDLTNPGNTICMPIATSTATVPLAPAATFNLSTLGFIPPFSVK